MLALIALLPFLSASTNAWSFDNQTCALTPPIYSCENTTTIENTCCSPVQGLVLTTQVSFASEIWRTALTPVLEHRNEASGSVLPKDSWGIHGLWPDNCDGTYGQYCDLSRQYDPRPSPNTTTGKLDGTPVPAWKGGDIFTPLLKSVGKYDLLAYINKHWKSLGAPDWDLWQHEFSKHATCFSNYDTGANGSPDCYGPLFANATEASIVEFIEDVVRAQVQYPTYKWLADAGITPSNETTYTLDQLQGVLTNSSGAQPYLGCSGPTRQTLSEVWYYAHALGRTQEGIYKPVDQTSKSSCNATAGVWYYERTQGSEA